MVRYTWMTCCPCETVGHRIIAFGWDKNQLVGEITILHASTSICLHNHYTP